MAHDKPNQEKPQGFAPFDDANRVRHTAPDVGLSVSPSHAIDAIPNLAELL